MCESIKDPIHKLCIHGVRSMWGTVYSIEDALKHHIHELQAQPELLAQLAEQSDQPIDLIARLEQLRQDAHQLERDISTAETWFDSATDDDEPRFEDLTPQQAADLAHLDEQLNGVVRHIQQIGKAIDATLVAPMADPANRLGDRNIAFQIRFLLNDDDPAYRDGGDNLVAEMEEWGSRVREKPDPEDPFYSLANSWPDGYDWTFPMPHGGLMHKLRLRGGYERGRVDYRDLLRIGSVWVDVVVDHQYQFDLVQGKWIKRWNVDHDQDTRQPVFVREE